MAAIETAEAAEIAEGERVEQTLKAGAAGLHIDYHLGTAGGLWTGTCFCDRCVAGFRRFLQERPDREREALKIADLKTYDHRAELQRWLNQAEPPKRSRDQHPL